MQIDIEPIIEKANSTDAICMEFRNIDALYVIRLANGKDFTIKWDSKGLNDFQSRRTISEMIDMWEKGIIRRYKIAENALKTGLHPTNTFERPITVKLSNGFEYPTGKTERVRCELDSYGKEHFKSEMVNRELEFGKMIFVKIIQQ